MWKHTWLLSCFHCAKQQLSREKAIWGWCYPFISVLEKEPALLSSSYRILISDKCLNLQAVIFLLHGININFLNFQVGNNQTDTTFYQRVCSKIPEKKSLILDWNHHLNWSISGVFKTSWKNIFKGYWIKSQHLTLKGKQRSRHWSWKQKLTDVFACPGMVLHSRNPRDVQETEVNQGRVSWHAQQKE